MKSHLRQGAAARHHFDAWVAKTQPNAAAVAAALRAPQPFSNDSARAASGQTQ